MTLEKLKTLLCGSGIPFTYEFWDEKRKPEFPYGAYYTDGADTVHADGGTALIFTNVVAELWTKVKSPDSEAKLENALTAVDISFSKGETSFERTENAFVTIYEFQI